MADKLFWSIYNIPETNEVQISSHWWYNNKTTYHCHDFYEIFFVIQGEITPMVNGKKQDLSAKSLCLLRPGESHMLAPSCNSLNYNLMIKAEYFDQLCYSISPMLKNKIFSYRLPITIHLSSSHLNYFVNLAKTYDIYNETDSSNMVILKSLICSILLDIDLFFSKLPTNQHLNIPNWFSELLNRMRSPSFLSKNVNDIYELSPCAPCTLIEYFHKYLDCTPMQYLTRIKLNYACSRLINTNATVLYIINEVGFNSVSHFNKIFKQKTGMSPSQYRKEHRGK